MTERIAYIRLHVNPPKFYKADVADVKCNLARVIQCIVNQRQRVLTLYDVALIQ